VENIYEALEELKSKNIELIDQTPGRGAGGSLIAFIHPRSAGGILIELKQEKEN
jgi:methylmalonyl-CoA/ethylmalonyl-CoA epimerase